MGSTFADSDFGDTVETQLTLGTGSLLGIFFGLVMVCGMFFGFGYSIGRRNSSSMVATTAPPARVAAPIAQAIAPQQPVAALTPAIKAPSATTAVTVAPPATATTPGPLTPIVPSTASAQPAGALIAAQPATIHTPKPSAIQPVLEQPNTRIPLQHAVRGPEFTAQNLPSPYFVWTPPFDVHYKRGFPHRVIAQTSRPTQLIATAPSPTLQRVATPRTTSPGPALTVQIAALSRADDAEVLASSLRERGFAPSIKSGVEDALFHVQVGPFSRDVAFATRQRLIAKGYNAILK
jgi:cell division septation protein DedD